MFKPKHTLESVTRQLIQGLEDGTIVLHDPAESALSTEELEKRLEDALARRRRQGLWVLLANLTAFALSLLSLGLCIASFSNAAPAVLQLMAVFAVLLFFALTAALAGVQYILVRSLAQRESAESLMWIRAKMGRGSGVASTLSGAKPAL